MVSELRSNPLRHVHQLVLTCHAHRSSTTYHRKARQEQPHDLACLGSHYSVWCSPRRLHHGKKKAPPEEIKEKEGDPKVMIPNPVYEDWCTGDQQVFSFILASVSKEILVRIATTTSAIEAWKVLEQQLTSQTRASIVTTRMALAITRKGNLSVAEYLAKMQGLSNDMAAAGKPLDDEDLVQYILASLDEDYDYVVNSVLACSQSITMSELST
jgi:hypothetical protein